MLFLDSVGGLFCEREISDKQDCKSWGGGECIVSSYSTLMQQQQQKNLPNDELPWHYK